MTDAGSPRISPEWESGAWERSGGDAACTAEEIAELLEKTSRTFALAIPLLPAPTDLQVGIAYLLFRIADTFEDAELWPRARKIEALARFGRLLAEPAPEAAARAAAEWVADPPSNHHGYVELLRRTPAVLGALWQLEAAPQRLIAEHTRRTAEGMIGFVERAAADGTLELADFSDLRRYCYVVAGIVGEMLTELFLFGRGTLAPVEALLRDCAARFGEALQLVNILKDSLADAAHGRRFLPATCEAGASMDLARRDREFAARYTLALQEAGAPRGIVAFTALPLRLARATLDLIAEKGPGAKLSRAEVAAILDSLHQALDQNLPAV
jgi:farnesyl-diphosphate farnesyltransferase